MKYSLFALLGIILSTGCEKQEPTYYPISSETNAWLPDQHGQVLTFATAAGATQTMQVARWQEQAEYTGKSFSVRSVTEWQYLVYKRPTAVDSGFSLAARAQQIAVLNTSVPSQYAVSYGPLLGTIHTAAQAYEDTNNGRRLKLAFNQSLAGRNYPALVTLDFPGVDSTATTATNRLQRLYLAKDHGLVAFRTANGQLWLRQ